MRDPKRTLWSTRSYCGKPQICGFGTNGQWQRYKFRCSKQMCSSISMFNYDFIPGSISVSMARWPRREELRSNCTTRILLIQRSDPKDPQCSRPTHTGSREVGPLWAHNDGVARHSCSHGRWGEPHWFGFWIFHWDGSCAGSLLLRECHGNHGKPCWDPGRWHLGGSYYPGLLTRTASHSHWQSQEIGWSCYVIWYASEEAL